MEKYPKYKDSGVKWIGEIPEHWEATPIKRVSEFNPSRKKELQKDDVISYAPMDKIKQGFMTPSSISYAQLTSGLTYFEENDIVMAKVTPCYENGNIAIATDLIRGCAYGSSELFVFRTFDIDRKFLFYYLQDEKFKSAGTSTMTGTGGLKRVSSDFIRNAQIPIPPLSEQHAIVSFLEKETSQIDSYIKLKEQEVERLNELKQAEIAHVVTKGLDPNVKMKDSGIAWIGEVPEHWEVGKLGEHFTQRRTKVSDKDYPALSVSKMGVTPQLETAVKTDNGDNRKLVLSGDFVVNSRSDRKGSCGFSDLDGSVSLINIVLTPRNLFCNYYHFLFRSNNYIEEFYRLGRGIVADLWTTRYSEMRTIMIPIPPLSEQQQIASYIETKVNQIDTYISITKREIEQMQEYKQRLISDAVTGKIKV